MKSLKVTIGKFAIAGFLILFCDPVFADSWTDLYSVQSQIDATGAQMGRETTERLQKLKQEVQAHSYENTLKLCEGYRRATGQGPVSYHGNWKYTEDEAYGEWLKIYTQGLMVLGSVIGGAKRDWIDHRYFYYKDIHAKGLKKWKSLGTRVLHEFYMSAYTIYFVNSLGFAQGAMHCLEVEDPRYITRSMNYFIHAILTVDALGAGTVDMATGGVVSAGFKKLLGTMLGRTLIWPFKAAFKLIKNRVFQATAVVWVTFDLPPAIEQYIEYREQLEKASNDVQDMMGDSERLTSLTDNGLYALLLLSTQSQFDKSFVMDRAIEEHEGHPICLRILNYENALEIEERAKHDLYDNEKLKDCKRLYAPVLNKLQMDWHDEAFEYYKDIESSDADEQLKERVRNFFPVIRGLYPLKF